MTLNFQGYDLVRYLKSVSPEYYGRLCGLRAAAAEWLSYIPSTFPAYTQHAVTHSDSVALQLSHVLFQPTRRTRPTIPLNGTETFILLSAAYLHDAGMVVSDEEKSETLASEEWNAWLAASASRKRRNAGLNRLRKGPSSVHRKTRNFLADVQLRHLLAEFYRERHHERASQLILSDSQPWHQLLGPDELLRSAIAEVCRAHGLGREDLDDRERYPDLTQIAGEDVNLLLIAVLVRLGDLLDLRTARACPCLLSAARPVPPDAVTQWAMADRIKQFSVTPSEIRILAECDVQEEHRALRDWCQWIVDEVRATRDLLARTRRHSDWSPPVATIDGSDQTLVIRPSARAKYVFREWRMELERDAVFRRMIFDLYRDRRAFIRELLQNALDASRSQMYLDMTKAGLTPPAKPTQVDEDTRSRYPVTIGLEERHSSQSTTGDVNRQFLYVDDLGIGMNEHVIEHYLLQIGRSYYTTEEYQRLCGFPTASRYGLGFLSAFAVSDHITVDTLRLGAGASPLRLVLTGPRNYLLVEQSSRRHTGTRVEVELRDAFAPGELYDYVKRWCRRAEFPVVVRESGTEHRIVADAAADHVYEIPAVGHRNARFIVRSFPIKDPAFEGEIYIFESNSRKTPRWDFRFWAKHVYPTTDPRAKAPPMPTSFSCTQGLLVEETLGSAPDESYSFRIDYRGRGQATSLARDRVFRPVGKAEPTREEACVAKHLGPIILRHLKEASIAQGPAGWEYRQRLAMGMGWSHPGLRDFWWREPGMVRAFVRGRPQLLSFADVDAKAQIVTLTSLQDGIQAGIPRGSAHACVRCDDLGDYGEYLSAVIDKRKVMALRLVGRSTLAVSWGRARANAPAALDDDSWHVAPLPWSHVAAVYIPQVGFDAAVINRRHPLGAWYVRVSTACAKGGRGVTQDQLHGLRNVLEDAVGFGFHDADTQPLDRYLKAWATLGLRASLLPPQLKSSPEMFSIPGFP